MKGTQPLTSWSLLQYNPCCAQATNRQYGPRDFVRKGHIVHYDQAPVDGQLKGCFLRDENRRVGIGKENVKGRDAVHAWRQRGEWMHLYQLKACWMCPAPRIRPVTHAHNGSASPVPAGNIGQE
ncbi:hypothetical protein O181_002245 [Austropuccinia psidii MF-1]|uniref:Uncharacterized protein n=1 Tax=Austropuccinia psidii MF-1 TaxID=1389203 RepID=A0A9Q3BC26_9BASI|nr:hypothetical protein [Austropuccinia psidii MF-1]